MNRSFEPTENTRVRRIPQRGSYDRETANAILDEAMICHLGFAVGEQPFVIPTIHARVAEHLYVHGAPASRMLKTLATGVRACVTVTLIDGLVLARSAFHHSMNYRSVVVLGQAVAVDDPDEKMRAFEAMTDRLAPGRWNDTRQPNDKELRATSVLRLPIEEASVKVRTGPPVDDEADMGLPHWAGVVPTRMAVGTPHPDPQLRGDIDLPAYLYRWGS